MKRQPGGVPTGGQFAADHKAEPSGSLNAPEPVFGTDFAAGVRDALGENTSSYARAFLAHSDKLVELGYTHEDFKHSYNGASTITKYDISPERFRAGNMFFSTDSFDQLPPLMRDHALNAPVEQLRRGIPNRPVPQDKDSVVAALEAAHEFRPGVYAAVLDEQLPFLANNWREPLMSNHALQPKSWAMREVRKAAIANERLYALTLERPTAPVGYPFVTKPVTELERDIDRELLAGGDVNSMVDLFKNTSGEGYGTLNIRPIAHSRNDALRIPVQQAQSEGAQK